MNNYQVVMLDNVDSFTYNLVDELRTLNFNMQVFRNTVSADTVLEALAQCASQGPTLLLLSPGPGAPSDAGCMPEVIARAAGEYPILGICLGHQAIVEHYGGTVVRAEAVVHGKASPLTHCGDKMFTNMPQPMSVARYHSLVAGEMPDTLAVLGQINDIPMVIHHAQDKMLGMQFHPESILTYHGSQLLRDSIAYLLQSDVT
jgi:anthranilate synthase component 2